MKYTIIITVYNKEKYIERAIKSALKQKKSEIIIINDGSTDNSEKIIKKYKNQKNIRYIYKENTGIADTRNVAIEYVNTKYFLFLDADDYLESNLIEEIDKYEDYDVLSFNAISLTENNIFSKKMIKPKYEGTGKEFFIKLEQNKSEFTVPWGYIYNTKYIKDNKFKYPKGKILEDYYLTPFILIEAKKIISIDYIGYYYIRTENSITLTKQKEITETYISYIQNIKKLKYDKKTNEYYCSFLAGTLVWYGSTLNKKERKKYIKELKKNKIVDLLIRKKHRKKIIKLLFSFNLYYPIRSIIKHDK